MVTLGLRWQYAEYIKRNAGLEEAQARIKIAGRNINNLRYADDTTLMAESEEELKNLLVKVKEESEKVGLKLNIQKTKIIASIPITLWQIDGETMDAVADFIFLGSKITADGDYSHEIQRRLPLERKVDQPRQHIKKQRHYFSNKGPSSQGYGYSSGHIWMWELDYKENWVPKNWCFWTVVLEKTLESPLDCKEIQPVHPKGDQSWVFIGRTDVEAETPIFWPPDVKSWLIWKDPETVFSPLYIPSSFVISTDLIITSALVYFWSFYPVASIYVSFSVPVWVWLKVYQLFIWLMVYRICLSLFIYLYVACSFSVLSIGLG